MSHQVWMADADFSSSSSSLRSVEVEPETRRGQKSTFQIVEEGKRRNCSSLRLRSSWTKFIVLLSVGVSVISLVITLVIAFSSIDTRELTLKLNETVNFNSKMITEVPRSCIIYKEKYNINEGRHAIDPDGPGLGDYSFSVTCKNGTTLVNHNLTGWNEIEICHEKSCYRHMADYNVATKEQIKILIANSRECRQLIEFDCLSAPLTNYGNWLDSQGNPNSYFYGSNNGKNVCSCSSNNTCRFSLKKEQCNCDVTAGHNDWQSDRGYITNQSALPISGFEYGFLSSQSKARFRIGPLECNGHKVIDETKQPCRKLRNQGVYRDDFYWFKDDKSGPYITYCRMSDALGIIQEVITSKKMLRQDWISSKIMFTAERKSSLLAEGSETKIGFETVFCNERKNCSMNKDGTFTAPEKGIYMFDYIGSCYDTAYYCQICGIMKLASNGAESWVNEGLFFGQQRTFSRTFSTELEVGDQLFLALFHGELLGIRTNSPHFHFRGFKF